MVNLGEDRDILEEQFGENLGFSQILAKNGTLEIHVLTGSLASRERLRKHRHARMGRNERQNMLVRLIVTIVQFLLRYLLTHR